MVGRNPFEDGWFTITGHKRAEFVIGFVSITKA